MWLDIYFHLLWKWVSVCLHGWPLDTLPMILRSLPFLEQTGKLNLPGIIIMRVPSTGSPSNPWFPTLGITVNLFSQTLFSFWSLRLWTWDKGVSLHLLHFSAFVYSLNLASKVMKIENFSQINKVICILLWSYFCISPTKDLFCLLWVSLNDTWLEVFFMQHRESQKKLNVCVLQPINSNF